MMKEKKCPLLVVVMYKDMKLGPIWQVITRTGKVLADDFKEEEIPSFSRSSFKVFFVCISAQIVVLSTVQDFGSLKFAVSSTKILFIVNAGGLNS